MTKRFRSLLVGVAIAATVIGGYWLYNRGPQITIVPYVLPRDRPFIEKLFERDWYWLTDKTFNPALFEQWLVHQSVTGDPANYGSIVLKMAQINDSDVGFVAYYLQAVSQGVILFIDVQPDYRSNRIGRLLLDHAVDDLKEHGATIVRLITRPHNKPARKLYERSGFKLFGETPQYVFYEKKLR